MILTPLVLFRAALAWRGSVRAVVVPLVLWLLWMAQVRAAEVAPVEKKVSFNIPADKAAQALKKFSAQSGQQLLYSNSDLAGVTTQEVKGDFTNEEALRRLLAGTPLMATRDQRNGAVAVGRESSGPKGQRAAPPPGDRPIIPRVALLNQSLNLRNP